MGYYKDNYFKMRVTPEEFRAVESAVVECGGAWQSGERRMEILGVFIYISALRMTYGDLSSNFVEDGRLEINPQEFIEGLRREHNIKLKFSGASEAISTVGLRSGLTGMGTRTFFTLDEARDEYEAVTAYARASAPVTEEDLFKTLYSLGETLEGLTEPEETDLEFLEKIELSQDMAMHEAGGYVPCTQQEYRHRTRFMFLDYDEDKKDYVFEHEYTERLLELE